MIGLAVAVALVVIFVVVEPGLGGFVVGTAAPSFSSSSNRPDQIQVRPRCQTPAGMCQSLCLVGFE